MRKPMLGLASLLVGTAAAFVSAAEPEILPVVDICAQTSGAAPIVSEPKQTVRPSKLHLVNDAATPKLGACDTLPAPCETCLPEPAAVVMNEPCCGCCKRQTRFWANAEYLLWTVKDEPLNAVLFTQGPIASGGRLGATGVQPLFGRDHLDFGSSNGGRIEAGYWLNNCHSTGVEVSAFLLERTGTGFGVSAGPNDAQAISRPFVNANTGAEDARFVSIPPVTLGGAFSWASTRFWGTDTDVVLNVRDRSRYRIDALVGFEYLDLQETLIVGDNVTIPRLPNFGISTIDSFATRNHFYGTDFGVRGTANRGRFDFTAAFKLGLGVTHESSEIVGQSQIITPAGSLTQPAGFLAVESNSGTQTRDRFAVAPQAMFKVAYRFTEHLNGFVAYDFLYLSNVMRPGDQIDRTVNPAQVPTLTGFNPVPVANLAGPARPSAEAVPGDFFAQGISLGLGVTY